MEVQNVDQREEITRGLISHFNDQNNSLTFTSESWGLSDVTVRQLKVLVQKIQENQKLQQLSMDQIYDTIRFKHMESPAHEGIPSSKCKCNIYMTYKL